MVNEKNPNTWQDWETDDWDKSQPAGFESWDESPWQSPFEKPFASQEWENSGWDAVDPLRQPAADDWNQSGWGKPSWEQSGWDQPGWDPPQPSPAPSNWQQQDSGWPTWQSDWDQPAGREERSTPAGTEHPRPQPVREQPPRRQAPAEPPMDDNMRALCAAVEGMQTTARVTGVDEKQLQALVHRVMIKPEYFWLDSRYSYRIQNGVAEVFFKLKYSNAPYLRRQLEQVTSQILAGMPRGGEYQRALYLHDWLCANVTYLKRGERTGQDIYEALCLRCCVCAGFSKAYAYLMQKVGIQCAVVEGDARGERHAWNRVVIGGNLYYTDVTWDRETSNRRCYEWFNLTSAQMLESHRPENPAEMPASTATADNYYRRNGLLLSTWDERQLVRILAKQKGDVLMVGFDRRQVYNKARQAMSQSDFFRLLEQAGHRCNHMRTNTTEGGWGITICLQE